MIGIELGAFCAGWMEKRGEAFPPGFPVGICRVFEVFKPSAAKGDVLDLIFKNPLHELAGEDIAIFGKDLSIEGSKVKVGHLKGEAKGADVTEGRC